MAQLGAVLGRQFSFRLLQAVSPLGVSELGARLRRLVEAELLHQEGTPPHSTYSFKHALVRDSAYQLLLRGKRRRLHRQVAEVLEGQFAETREMQPELVAYHLTEANLAERAIPFWKRAGERAVEHSAYTEAMAHFQQALALLDTLSGDDSHHEQELALRLALGPPLVATRGWFAPEVGGTYDRAHQLCRDGEESSRHAAVLRGLASHALARHDFARARDLEGQLLRLAQRVADPGLLATAHRVCGESAYWDGDFAAARDHLEAGIAVYDSPRHNPSASGAAHDPGIACLYLLAQVLLVLGYPDAARARDREATELARKLQHPYTLASSLIYSGSLRVAAHDWKAARSIFDEAGAISKKFGFTYWPVIASRLWAYALAAQGRSNEALSEIRSSIPAWEAIGGINVGFHSYLGGQAFVYGAAGLDQEASSLLEEAFAFTHTSGQHGLDSWLHFIRGELLLSQHKGGGEPEAEECFKQALVIAGQQCAKWFELRASTSLARLWHSQGKTAEACALLAPVYNWFTEGFDTEDLKDAKALLGSWDSSRARTSRGAEHFEFPHYAARAIPCGSDRSF